MIFLIQKSIRKRSVCLFIPEQFLREILVFVEKWCPLLIL